MPDKDRTLRHYQAMADEAWSLTNPWTDADDAAFHAWAHGTSGPPDDVWGEAR